MKIKRTHNRILDTALADGVVVEVQRGGPGRGQGRKPLAKTGELMKARPVRMTDEEWAKCKRLGGAAWVRAKIKAARET